MGMVKDDLNGMKSVSHHDSGSPAINDWNNKTKKPASNVGGSGFLSVYIIRSFAISAAQTRLIQQIRASRQDSITLGIDLGQRLGLDLDF